MKTSWLLLLLLLTFSTVDCTEDIVEVPKEFQKLQHAKSVISEHERRPEDVQFGNGNLQLWTGASNRGDIGAIEKVASRSAIRNNENNIAEISQFDAYDHEVIIQLQSDDAVQKAADSLFNKETKGDRSKSLLKWDGDLGEFRLLKSKGTKAVEITENTKLTVVGHGEERDGEVSVGGKTADQLVDVIAKLRENTSPLHWSSKQGNIKEMSIVSCAAGAGEEGESFLKKFLLGMKEGKITVGSVSARTVKVLVDKDGRKLTIDLDNSEWLSRHNPAHKRKFYLDNNNKLVEVSNTKERSSEWPNNQDPSVEYEPHAERNIPIPNDPLFYKGRYGLIYRMPDEDILKIIRENMEQRFGTEVDNQNLNTEIVERIYTESGPKEKFEVRTINCLDDLLKNIKDIIQTSNSNRRAFLQENQQALQRYRIKINNNIKIKDTWYALQKKKKYRARLREISRDIVNKMKGVEKYFRFKDYIYSINMDDFYVNLYGTTKEEKHEDVRKFIKDVKNRERNKNIVTYSEMREMKNKDNFVNMAELWLHGKENEIGEINPYDGMALLATHISEVVRNPDMFITNLQLWELCSKWTQFLNKHPMTRGKTWTGNHAAIGLEYETADQNEQINVKDRTLSIMKELIIGKGNKAYYSGTLEEMQRRERMTLDDVRSQIGDIIDLLGKERISPPHGSRAITEDEKSDLLTIEKEGREKSLETELHLKMMEDRKQLTKKITDKIREQTPDDLSGYQKVKSVERYEEGVKMVLQNKQNPSETKEILMPGLKDTLKSEDLLNSYFEDSHPVSSKINQGLGIYGTLMGFHAAIQMFAEGRKWEGGVMLAQGVHGLSELTGVNAAVNDFVGNIAQKSVAKISAQLEETAAAEFTSSMSKAGNIAREVPVLSAAFTIFNVYEDLKQNSTIGIMDAVLDEVIFVSALAGPEILPVTVALSIIRLVIDPLYHEIRHELEALPPNARMQDTFVAVIKGIGLAERDLANSFLDVLKQIHIFGMIYNVYSLEEEHRKSMDTVHKLQTAENYFRILDEKDGVICHRKVDFTQGEESAYGGNLRVELTDHSSMNVTLTDPVTSKRIEKEIQFEKGCETVDLVMGIGEAINIKMQQKTATAFWFIPLMTEEVISSMALDDRSLHGTYIGNAKPNRFFAVQKKIIKGLSYTLDKYHYELYGRDGNDIFFLGPQMSFVHGGNGEDIYYIPHHGGKTEICNQATDNLMDLLVFNIRFRHINARKIGNDLKLFYNNLHELRIKKWFLGEEYQHMHFKSSDGIFFDVGQVQLSGKVDLRPVTVDFSNQHSARNINLQDSPWNTVVTLIGTDFDDMLNGNQLNNVIQGRGGANTIAGHEGKDMYIIQEKGSCDTIDNFANDDLMDIVELPAEFESLKVTLIPPYSLKIWDTNGKSCVIMKDWERGWQWQHIIFKTKDLVVFQVSNTTAEPQIYPLVLDYSNSEEGVNINLNSIPGNEHIMTLIGSSYFDTIQGNSKANFIQKGRGGGTLTGGDGSDTYIVDFGPRTTYINNYADDGVTDVLYIKEKYSELRFLCSNAHRSRLFGRQIGVITHLEISSTENHKIILKYWFRSEQYRHLQFRTEDGIIFSLPGRFTSEQCRHLQSQTEDESIFSLPSRFTLEQYRHSQSQTEDETIFSLPSRFTLEQYRHSQFRREGRIILSLPRGIKPVIYAIDNSRDTLPMDVLDTRSGIFEGATKIIGPPRYIEIFGNAKDNYIDPGKNGASMTGEDGRDTYQLKKYYEGSYDINNYATDFKLDYLILDVNFKDIQYAVETSADPAIGDIKNIVLTAPSAANWRCRLLQFGTSEHYRHLIVQTNDVWFTFSQDTLEMLPLFLDHRFLNKELHLDLSAGILHSLPTVYGSLKERNFIDGNALNNTIIGGKNTDVLCGEDGNDVLQGSDGKDYLSGGPGDDQIHGGEGDDLILGEAGNDLIYPGPGADTVYGGTGSDTLLFLGNISSEAGVSVNLHLGFGSGADAEGDLYFGMENILGSSYDDILIGNDDDNYINGGGGSDLIQPMGGYDVLHGGEGKDVYNLIGATGVKMINNFAMDGKEDLIFIDKSDKLEISQSKSNDDHELAFYYSTGARARLRVLIKNWYKSERNRHLHMRNYRRSSQK